ncbi:MAG: alpha/beta hydrolase [Gammaproteobacteria bacterium]|jgi:pimeloyl-ACP methyl ester carboxylesterase|nr:alpha/beta hydrolase [Gammaproteobacteria bacterium]
MVFVRRLLGVLAGLLVLGYLGLIGYAYWPQPAGVPAATLASADDRFIEAGGMTLRYRVWGEPHPGRPPLVLMHGFGNTVQTFRDLAPALADTYQVIALDMPGFGLSDKPADHDYSNASQAAVVVEFMRALGLKNPVIGGHSMGGALALHVAQQAPEVSGMILMNPGIITTGVPAIAEFAVFPLPRLTAKTFGDAGFRERFLKQSYVNPDIVTPAVVEDVMVGALTDDYLTGSTQMMKYYKSGDEEGMLPDIRVPALIVWGVEDKSKPDGEAELLAAELPNSRLALIPGAGHYVQEEKPLESAAAIVAAQDFWAVNR